MRVGNYLFAALLAAITTLSLNLSPAEAQSENPTIIFPTQLNRDKVSFEVVRMMQKAGYPLRVYEGDLRVFRRSAVSPTCLIDPKVPLAIFLEDTVAMTLIETSDGVELTFRVTTVVFPRTPDEHREEATHGEKGRTIHMKLEALRASLQGRDPKTVGFEAIQ